MAVRVGVAVGAAVVGAALERAAVGVGETLTLSGPQAARATMTAKSAAMARPKRCICI